MRKRRKYRKQFQPYKTQRAFYRNQWEVDQIVLFKQNVKDNDKHCKKKIKNINSQNISLEKLGVI